MHTLPLFFEENCFGYSIVPAAPNSTGGASGSANSPSSNVDGFGPDAGTTPFEFQILSSTASAIIVDRSLIKTTPAAATAKTAITNVIKGREWRTVLKRSKLPCPKDRSSSPASAGLRPHSLSACCKLRRGLSRYGLVIIQTDALKGPAPLKTNMFLLQ